MWPVLEVTSKATVKQSSRNKADAHTVMYAQHAHTVLGKRLHVVVGRRRREERGERREERGHAHVSCVKGRYGQRLPLPLPLRRLCLAPTAAAVMCQGAQLSCDKALTCTCHVVVCEV